MIGLVDQLCVRVFQSAATFGELQRFRLVLIAQRLAGVVFGAQFTFQLVALRKFLNGGLVRNNECLQDMKVVPQFGRTRATDLHFALHSVDAFVRFRVQVMKFRFAFVVVLFETAVHFEQLTILLTKLLLDQRAFRLNDDEIVVLAISEGNKAVVLVRCFGTELQRGFGQGAGQQVHVVEGAIQLKGYR